MMLFWSPTSPYARKVVACAIARGIKAELELRDTKPGASPPELIAMNPLSKIPCLVTVDGTAVYDSPVICDYLDSIGHVPPMTPAGGPARLRVQVMHALADGILDAAMARRSQAAYPQDEGRLALDARQKTVIDRALSRLEAAPPVGLQDVGAIAVVCALGYTRSPICC
jgi:glutathione S-transferase